MTQPEVPTMTKLLEEAFSAIARLPEQDQDAIAALIMEELVSEERWSEAFTKSQDQLSQLADEAVEEFRKGQTKPWDL
mgnify:CR=1 FL=1